ncbi:MAG: hypothetical protein ACFFDH_00120 [Promethearchaeota archaeon]
MKKKEKLLKECGFVSGTDYYWQKSGQKLTGNKITREHVESLEYTDLKKYIEMLIPIENQEAKKIEKKKKV